MQTTVQETDKHTVKLTIEVSPEEFGKDLDRAYRKISQQVKIPGFRKGKVPRKVIDAQIGRDAVLGEFLEDSVPPTTATRSARTTLRRSPTRTSTSSSSRTASRSCSRPPLRSGRGCGSSRATTGGSRSNVRP
jgi:hypothetical protein